MLHPVITNQTTSLQDTYSRYCVYLELYLVLEIALIACMSVLFTLWPKATMFIAYYTCHVNTKPYCAN